jgi:hypothetical protein
LRQIPDLQLVILDSLSDFTPSLSISNDASANRIVQGMKMLSRELDCAVIAVAHPIGDGSRMLGAGRLFNAADFVIRVQPDAGSGSSFESATVSCEKNKYGPMFEPFGYEIVPCAWEECGVLIETATVRQPEAPPSVEVRVPRGGKPLPTLIVPEPAKRKRTGVFSGRR